MTKERSCMGTRKMLCPGWKGKLPSDRQRLEMILAPRSSKNLSMSATKRALQTWISAGMWQQVSSHGQHTLNLVFMVSGLTCLQKVQPVMSCTGHVPFSHPPSHTADKEGAHHGGAHVCIPPSFRQAS